MRLPLGRFVQGRKEGEGSYVSELAEARSGYYGWISEPGWRFLSGISACCGQGSAIGRGTAEEAPTCSEDGTWGRKTKPRFGGTWALSSCKAQVCARSGASPWRRFRRRCGRM